MTTSAAIVMAMLLAADSTSIEDRKLPVEFLKMMRLRPDLSKKLSTAGRMKSFAGAAPMSAAAAQSGVPGIDSLTNWTGQFVAPGFDPAGNPNSVWPFSMVGNPPESGRPSFISAPIIPVVVDLLRADGSVAFSFDGTQFAQPVLKSPIFQPYLFSSGFTQFNDAMFRSEFASRTHGESWHTLLVPSVKTTRRMRVPFFTPVGARAWFVFINTTTGTPMWPAIDADLFVSLLFPQTVPVDNTTVIGAAELAGDMTTRDLSTLLFDNVLLFVETIDNCCIGGFHSYDLEPGDTHNGNRERRFVMNFSSWFIGFFFFGFQDIASLSHEIAETFHDPFVDNLTPWWLSVDDFTGLSLCQDVLETGDVIELISTLPVFPIFMNGRTYHPQNEANFSWFAFESPSTAANGSYSFPDETTLTALSPSPLLPGCKPAP